MASRDDRGATASESAEQALARSLQHARNSASEALLALRALMDALSIHLVDEPVAIHAAADSPLGMLSETLENWVENLGREPAEPIRKVLATLLDAIDQQIDLWEARSRSDPDARRVLRAFLGLREIIWEFRPSEPRRPAATKKEPGPTPASAGIRSPGRKFTPAAERSQAPAADSG